MSLNLYCDAIDREVQLRFDGLIRRGVIFRWRSRVSPESGSIQIEFSLTSDDTQIAAFEITREELYSIQDIGIWLDTVTEDLIHRSERLRHEFPERFDPQIEVQRSIQRNLMEGFDRLTREALLYGTLTPIDDKSEEKAEALFGRVAGAAPLVMLKSGKPISLTGSAGGRYRLFARRAYCVERQSDDARMCAVVPGVPLYDHLLGIKLTVETDEPRFLKTANVTTGGLFYGTAASFVQTGVSVEQVTDSIRRVGDIIAAYSLRVTN